MSLFKSLSFLFLLESVGGYSPSGAISRIRERQSNFILRAGADHNANSISRRAFTETFIVSFLETTAIQSPVFAMTTNQKTGIALPDPGEIEGAIPKDWSVIDNPFEEALFGRLDSKPDSIFYSDPRFVEHVDSTAVQLMTNYVSNVAVEEGDAVLDLCSSWTSHYDVSSSKTPVRFAGLGMNAKELEANTALSDWVVQDLNMKPELPYKDDSFDTILCQLSIDYLTSPLQVMKEAGRILKPGGKIHIMFSNRLFLSKAVGLWTGADDIDHAYYAACELYFSGGGFQNIKAKDLSTRKGKQITGDPLYVVTAEKKNL
jgi:hypothetical protein